MTAFGRPVEDIGDIVAPVDGQDIELAIDSKVQFFAYQRVREAVAEHKAKPAGVVARRADGEVLALANYPSYVPSERRGLSGAQLRNRALTDTFRSRLDDEALHRRRGPWSRAASRPTR